MRSARLARSRASWSHLPLCVLALLASAVSVRASVPEGWSAAPELISPAAGATEYESGLRFAWKPRLEGARQLLLVSREPFDTRGWTRLPSEGAIRIHEVKQPVASLEQLGMSLDADGRLYWAAASEDPATGRVSFSETRSFLALRKFMNRVEPSPYLRVSPIGRASAEARSGPDRIRLMAGYEIDPHLGEPMIPEQLRGFRPDVGGPRTYLVYYGDADPEVTRSNILAAGGTVVAHIPDHTFLVRMGPSSQYSLDSEGSWVGAYQPAYKLSPRLALDSTAPTVMSVLLFPDGDLDAVSSAATALGGEILVSSNNGINKILRISAPGSVMSELAQNPDVAWIEPTARIEAFNNNVQWVVQTRNTDNRRLWDLGLHGEGQVIMTSDSGLEMTHNQFRDPAVSVTNFGDYPTHRKVIAYKLGGDDSRIEFGDHGVYHGSHTACTALGSDDPVGGASTLDGVAKAAKLYFMDLAGSTMGNGLAPFADLNDLFQPSYTGNGGGAARISSNSWGAPVAGAYDLIAMNADQFMWNHPDYLIFFANGNSGTAGSVGSPATAKSIVSAGGTRNAAVCNQIYGSTSKGPTQDQRRKPTICAPADGVNSASAGNTYQSLSGTSMATPAMAGAAALIRQYLTEGWYPTGTKVPANAFVPSAALLKAFCVNSADNQVQGGLAPDNNIGFGRIDCDSALLFAGDQRRLLLVDMAAGLGHLQQIEYQVNVTDGSIPLEVTLCWTDYPGSLAASVKLVNNLNLTVTNGVVTYRGNVYATSGANAGFSNTGGSYDVRNVEEAVRIFGPATGIWTIRIEGANVPLGPQPFGLCITGGVGTTAGALAMDRATYGSGSTVDLRVTDTNAGASVNVTLTSPTEPGGETVTLPGANGLYEGSITLSPFFLSPGNGILQVSSGDVITASYQDASPAATVVVTAQVSFTTPIITNVAASAQGGGSVLITWTTDVNASSKVYYGTTPALGSSTTLDPLSVFSHQSQVSGLQVGQTYYYDVESQDLNGNVARDDNGGAHYQVTVRPIGDLLLVYSGDDFQRASTYNSALATLNWSFDNWKGSLSDNPQLGNLASGMRAYKVVWWQVDLEEYPPFTDAARDVVTQYLDGGGRLAVTGHDIAWAFSDPASAFYTAARDAWMNNTLHTFYNADPPGWTSVTGIGGDPISGDYTGGISYGEHRAGASGDEVASVAGAGTASYDWVSGEATPDNCGLRWESNAPLGSAGTAFWGGQRTRLAAMYFEWTGITVTGTRNDVMNKTLSWLLGRERPVVTVVSPNGGTTITTDTTPIDWTETTSGGTSVTSRKIEYSPNSGQSWVLITSSPGASPYTWDLTAVPNAPRVLVRVTVTDDGSPAFSGSDQSNSTFTIRRTGGDTMGPAVVAGSIRVNPNPVSNQASATLTATVTDSLAGASNVAAAEWSIGDSPAPAGTGTAMTGTFTTPKVAVSASLSTGGFVPGQRTLWVRGQDQSGNWGQASPLSVAVNGTVPLAVQDLPRSFELWQNAPNPMFQATTISYAVPVESAVRVLIFDVNGRRVRELVGGTVPPGIHRVEWNGADDSGRRVGPGLYYLRLIAGGRSFQRRMVALR